MHSCREVMAAVQPDYGTLADLDRLIEEAHRRKLRVIADLVLNHCSDQHPWFQSARASRNSPYRDWFVWSDTRERYRDVRVIFNEAEPSNWTLEPTSGQYYWHRFYHHQPDLNFDNPAVREEMLRAADFWLARGLDGFRCDAVPYLFEREGTDCAGLPETHDYLRSLRAHVDAKYTSTHAIRRCVSTREFGDDWHPFWRTVVDGSSCCTQS